MSGPFQAGDEIEVSVIARLGHNIALEITNPREEPTGRFEALEGRDKIKYAIKKLYRIAANDRVMGSHRESFLATNVKESVQELGEQLNRAGGMPAMWMAYYGFNRIGVRDGVEQPGDLAHLNIAWDGIGEWQY
jgi:hypothetical protein